MIVYAYAADMFGCGWHRIMWPAGVLQAQGHDVRVIRPGDPTGMGGTERHGHMVTATCPADADVIVLQRPCNRRLAESVPLLRARGVAVVVDMDDDLGHINPRNPSFHGLHPARNPDENWSHAAAACRDATLVTVSTPQLAAVYGKHGRVRVVGNCVPAAWLERPRVDASWVGWAGSLHSHPDDLSDVAGAIQRHVNAGGDFRVIGDGVGVAKACGLPDVAATGVVPFDRWGEAVGMIGVGIAPLADTRFNAGKSALKPLTMAALGVPYLASDVAEYRRFLPGRVVHRRAWLRAITQLTHDAGMRDEWSSEGSAVAAAHTYEGEAWRWLEAWSDAVAMQAGRLEAFA